MTSPIRFCNSEPGCGHKALAFTAAVLVVLELTFTESGHVMSATPAGRAIVGLILIWVLVRTVDTTAHFSLILIGLTAMASPILVTPGVSSSLMLPVRYLGIENLWQLMYIGGAVLIVIGSNYCGIHLIKSALSAVPTLPVGNQHKSIMWRPDGLRVRRRIVNDSILISG